MILMRNWFASIGLTDVAATVAALTVGVGLAALFAEALNVVGRLVALRLAPLKDAWIEAFHRRSVFRRAAWVAMFIVIEVLVAPLLVGWSWAVEVFRTGLRGAMVVSLALTASGAITAITDVFRSDEGTGSRLPLKVLGQALQLVLWSYTTVVFLSVVTHRDVTTLLAGLTAVGAVLVYVFRDPILGWTAGVQISANDLVWTGDWITAPSHRADGRVVEIALTTVKVRNWDHTISTIPTYALVSEGFRNWRSMFEAGGRRIRRTVTVDATSIRWEGAPDRDAVGRTNLGDYRAWLEAWLRRHPQIHEDMRIVVRELAAQHHGIPVEIYAFSKETNLVPYEHLQAEVFDHALAALSSFGLRPYQAPNGADVRELAVPPVEVQS